MSKIYFFLGVILLLTVVVYVAIPSFGCSSLCQASSIAKHADEAMLNVEDSRTYRNVKDHSVDSEWAVRQTLHPSPYVDEWSVRKDGSVIFIGRSKEFMLTFKPEVGEKIIWQCSGFPAKVVSDVTSFLHRANVKNCEVIHS